MIQTLEWRFAFRNLLRNKRRSLSTSIGLVIAYLGISMLVAYLSKAEMATRDFEIYLNYLGHVQIYKKGGAGNIDLDPTGFQISETEIHQIFQVLENYKNRIDFIAGLQSTEALLSNGTTSTPIWLQGIPPELDNYVYQNPHSTECCPYVVKARVGLGMLEATRQYPDAISVSHGVSELLQRSRPIEEMTLDEKQFSIAGRSLSGDLNAVSATLSMKHTTSLPFLEDFSVKAPLALVQDLLQSKGVSRFAIFLKSPDDRNLFVEQLNQDFKTQHLNVEVLTFTDKRVGVLYNGTVSFLLALGSFIGTLILIASGLIVMNSVTMSVMERLKEIGTMRALGYPPSRIRNIFAKEAFCISLFSGLMGIFFSEVIAKIVNSLNLFYSGPGYSVPLPLKLVTNPYVYCLLLVAFVGVSTLFSFLVVTRKSKESIISLLIDSGTGV